MSTGHAPDWMNFIDPTGKFQVKHQGAYPVVQAIVTNQDKVLAEGGAMISMHDELDLTYTRNGTSSGCCNTCLRCCCAEESLFLTEYLPKPTAPPNVGLDLLLSPSLPGFVVLLHLDGQTKWRLSPGAYLCGDPGVTVGATVQDCAKGCCSGEGFVILTAEGTGRMIINSYGSILRYDLAEGEKRIVDNGMLVAWTAHTQYKITKASPSIITSFLSGEGFVCTFEGPGTVFIQSRNIADLARGIAKYLPIQMSSEGGGE